jgi:phosphoenolpyruvate carboxykinase (ATP)
MKELGQKPTTANLVELGLGNVANAIWNLSPGELMEATVTKGMGTIADSGALAIDTGEFKGRSPKDRFVVCDQKTEETVWWGDINIKFSTENYDNLYRKVTAYLEGKDVYVRDGYACADDNYRLNIRTITEYPWSNLFASNMFLRPTQNELIDFTPEWHIICAPGFKADPKVDGTRQHNFTILNFTSKQILIGGTGYTGEIKKGVFSVLNYVLPYEKNVLSMHCSANIGRSGDTAIFFGLSGTGKTTLSADQNRQLIGDDEHGWAEDSVFNFEGGCYAKCIHLTQEQEPQIWNAIKKGSILENINFFEGTSTVDFDNSSKTENTRVSYPIDFIDNFAKGSKGGKPSNIFFLTADAYGVLPPISKLTRGQAMFHFISGYTAKVAGTEVGVNEPQATFSACFGKAFLPLHPTKYAEMLGDKITSNDVNVWLVNTGWSGGSYGVGKRMSLKYTRAMITAALQGDLDNVDYYTQKIFGLHLPTSCPNVPDEILNPRNTWKNKDEYDQTASLLAEKFVANFEQYKSSASQEILDAAPKGTMIA